MSPIRPENRDRYPADWPAIRTRILARAHHRCEWCGKPNGRDVLCSDDRWCDYLGRWWNYQGKLAGMPPLGTTQPVRIVLTIAHLDHTPENCGEANLRALCQRCHLRYDSKQHQDTASRTRDTQAGQGRLF